MLSHCTLIAFALLARASLAIACGGACPVPGTAGVVLSAAMSVWPLFVIAGLIVHSVFRRAQGEGLRRH